MKTLLVTFLAISGSLPLSLSEIASPFVFIASVAEQSPGQSAYVKQKEIELNNRSKILEEKKRQIEDYKLKIK